MWEVMLVSSLENRRIIQYVYKLMRKLVQEKSCILTLNEDKINISILFACAKGKKDYYKEMIKVCIIDYIINVYKYEYLIKNINNFVEDEMTFKSFIKLLSLYDKSTDETVLKKLINIDRCFYIDSFINFRLYPLIIRWKELCSLAKDNFDYFLSTEGFVEIMRFLVATMEENCDKIKILQSENKYALYNVNKINEIAEKIEDCSTPFSLISAVLRVCPKTIDIYCNNYNDKAIIFLQNVYEDRVNVMKNE